VVSLSAVGALYLYVNSPTFNTRLRNFIVERISTYTGTRVTLQSLRWSLRQQRVILEDLTLRGTEPDTAPPLAHIESISAGVNFRSLLHRHLDLYELHFVNPEIRFNVDSEGRTTLPTPTPPKEQGPESEFVVSVDNLKVTGGKAFINNRQSDLDFAIANLKSDLKYGGDTRRFTANISYDGTLTPVKQKPIPYTLTSAFDFTEGTLVAQSVRIVSGKSTATFQGRIDKVLTPDITGKLAYAATLDGAVLKNLLPQHTATGAASLRGELEFSAEKFNTTGDVSSREIAFDKWKAQTVKARYAYNYPMKQLSLTRVTAQLLGGSAEGTIVADKVPGTPHVTTNIMFTNVDVAQLADAYPWDRKYMVYSRASGQLRGTIDGNLERYAFDGDSSLVSYRAPATGGGIIALPLDGSVAFTLSPSETAIKRSDLHFLNSTVSASGRVVGTDQLDLTVNLMSSNLADIKFIYPDANGQGSFKGTVKGPVATPVLDGTVTLDGHKYREWTIQHAEGGVKVDTAKQLATLRDVTGRIGESTATLNGTASLDGKELNLQIRSDHVKPSDFESITKEKIGGIVSGNVTLTSVNPIKVAGHVKGVGLSARGHTFDVAEGDLTYNDPVLQLRNVTASERDTRIAARTIDYNISTKTVRAVADVTSLSLSRLQEFGVPDTLGGIIRTAHLEVSGVQDKPQIQGNAIVEDLSFRGETFPHARIDLNTNWPNLNIAVSETGNVSLTAQVDVGAKGYPFKASAQFQNYSIEKLANFSQGRLSVTGNAAFRGQLTGDAPFSGEGNIRNLDARIRDVEFHNANPFEFVLEPSRIRLDKEATLTGAYGTSVNVKGSIGLSMPTALDLEVRGNFNLSEISVATDEWSISGNVALNGRVNGTATNPAINGLLTISNAALGREGVYTTLSALNGTLRFDANRVNFENLKGRVGGGDVQIRGTAVIQNGGLEGLDVRVDALNPVRLRGYLAGIRSSVVGTLAVTGSSASPLVTGDLTLSSMSYDSDFEAFLAVFRSGSLDTRGSMLDRVRLGIHVAGSRNISVRNELANISSANIDLKIGGTWASPSVIGHAEISEGMILFQGKKYEVTRGNIDFANPLKIEPRVDIQAETDVRDYRVILTISGIGDRIRATFSTDPPLPETEVVSLVAGGKTREELGQSNTTSSEQLFQSGAKNIVAGQLLSNVGRRFGLMGLDWVRLDPQFETNTNNPSLRVTLTHEVSKGLSVTYAQDLASTQQRLVTIEYFLSKNLSVVASREETNDASALGLDIKLRRRY
jgi:translocation and assembly module TamB